MPHATHVTAVTLPYDERLDDSLAIDQYLLLRALIALSKLSLPHSDFMISGRWMRMLSELVVTL